MEWNESHVFYAHSVSTLGIEKNGNDFNIQQKQK